MKGFLILIFMILGRFNGFAQSFELLDKQEAYQSGVSQTLHIPLRIKNTSDKAQFYIVRRVQDDLNSTQKGYFCLDKNCLEPGIEEFSKKIEPGETLQNLYFALETGLVGGQHTVRFEIFPQASPGQTVDRPISISIDDHNARAMVFQTKDVVIHDLYPNPVYDQASIDYSIHSDMVKAKIVIHNILGRPLGDYDLPASDTKVRILAEDLPPGVYFYTLYLNGEGVFTRKLIVRK
jgi:Secretion system C-terminal sorting domain